MAVGCKAAVGCVDARVPVRASYVSLYKWPESDAEFVRSVAMARRQVDGGGLGHLESPAAAACYRGGAGSASMRRAVASGDTSPRVVDSYSCRQMYLRSYTFSRRKETVSERTMACLGRVRERASVFPFLPQRGGGGSDTGSVDGGSTTGYSAREEDGHGRHRTGGGNKHGRRKRIRKKKKGCAVVRRLHEASCSVVRVIFHRLLACTTSVDVEVTGTPSFR